ncbi:hypothetical protein F-M6_0071 [Faustovirus]|nr:hypothetical protein F-M6_0071 [Faustovirus]
MNSRIIIPVEYVDPDFKQIVLRRDKITRWRQHHSYIPANCIQLPTEMIYMIAELAPIEFAATSREYYCEFGAQAAQLWNQIVLQRSCEELERLHKAFMAARFTPSDHRTYTDRLFVPLDFWFARDAGTVAVPVRSIYNWGAETILRYAT